MVLLGDQRTRRARPQGSDPLIGKRAPRVLETRVPIVSPKVGRTCSFLHLILPVKINILFFPLSDRFEWVAAAHLSQCADQLDAEYASSPSCQFRRRPFVLSASEIAA